MLIHVHHINCDYTHTHTAYLPSTAVPHFLHNGVYFLFKHLGQFGAVFIHPWRLPVIQPGVIEHQPHVVHVLPGLLVLTRVQLTLDSGQVHRVFYYVKVVLEDGVQTTVSSMKDEGHHCQYHHEMKSSSSQTERWMVARRVENQGERRGCRGTMLSAVEEVHMHKQRKT